MKEVFPGQTESKKRAWGGMKMKSIILSVLSLLIVGAGVDPQETAGKDPSGLPLDEFVSFAEGEHLKITSWSVTMKENVSKERAAHLQQQLRADLPQGTLTEQNGLKARKWILNRHKSGNFDESFVLILPRNSNDLPEMVYTLSSEGTASLTAINLDKYVNLMKRRYFTKNVTIFSCLKANASDMINDVLVYQKFKNAFNIATIEEVIENSWTSRSGYTEQWGNALPLAKDQMNVQFATRTLGGKTNITIGTPIISAEY
ncbi:YwmB family TATA-box binding protein [Halobacillus salinarum]|uniref:YwmB family TATA-box binding protein n=1 Tax=Halobacillus salinarum TaxID=2932257 RepID=A0ABY4EMS0_9BACI|nr:YwmB family TATA-box binding protein [Halobacillus salinarum]UOQ45361.1 YwmB family TATA-box binding protein [Halobacillus salinarum]